MIWKELEVSVNNEAKDAVINILMDLDSSGVKIDELENNRITITSYHSSDIDLDTLLPGLKSKIGNLSEYGLNPGEIKVTTSDNNDDAWSHEWEKYYEVTKITRYLTVVPKWKAYQPTNSDEIILKMNPGKAFGTGLHPTTILCLQALEMYIRGQEEVLDVGTGTAILSIAAKKMGAGKTYAFDNDDNAIVSSKENIELNDLSNEIVIKKNSLLDNISRNVDLIVANMLPEAIFPLIPQAFNNLKENGVFIISGIIDEKLTDTINKLKTNHFTIKQTFALKNWRGIVAIKEF
ncbi:50S ribosomal protein L11 methyltransferase [Apilactobacillus ozensis]|uniref:50S ribosomal protein L11 methyltransferase n=1 Tax=Apilactobacillus ozensis TaxID=866801 RepID=UPI00200A8E9A|nr:50S ribosomal protein L11 methyltransferase [Apilactobacillus ozensis]MCK8606894.1 50S ribosomal protein L11 methyltransferase [Apilactobacillus ozensis]